VIAWFMAAATAGILATMPYEQSLTYASQSMVLPWPALLFAGIVNLTLVFLCVLIGLHLGRGLGLGAPDVESWAARRPGAGRALWSGVRHGLLWGAAAGIATTGLAAAAEGILPLPDLRPASWTPWQGLLGSIGAGINEELIFRLGLMTMFARLLGLLVRRVPPPPALLWAANALAALGFGCAHLPILSMFTDVVPATIGLVLAGNGLVAMVFGWLYWRRGIAAAMAGHFATDIILKAIVPALTGS
jgi:membrane protease YdiL (CAAX protease family)